MENWSNLSKFINEIWKATRSNFLKNFLRILGKIYGMAVLKSLYVLQGRSMDHPAEIKVEALRELRGRLFLRKNTPPFICCTD